MEYLVLDWETTIFQNGNPYSQQNRGCLLGIKTEDTNYTFDIEYSDHGYKSDLDTAQSIIDATKLIIGFNLKFDLTWCRRYGLTYNHHRIWDCQLVHFILSGQTDVFPSLNEVAAYYGLGTKLDIVKEEYWNKGLDTTEVPKNILEEYLIQDLILTEQVYLNQLKQVRASPKEMQRLISLSMQDLLVLLEMEWNGIKLDFMGMEQASNKCLEKITQIKGDLNNEFSGIPAYCLNYNSNDCLSAILYGGTIVETVREAIGTYRSGPKTGLDRYKKSEVTHVLPRKIQPPKGSELKKQGFYSTNEETLRSIKANKADRVVLDKILELSKIEKLNSTYYEGLIRLHATKDWEKDYIHGQFNQCIARTGRLSSSAPNLQNFPPDMDRYTVTRYP